MTERDLDVWAEKLVNREPTVDIVDLEKIIELHQLTIDCAQLEGAALGLLDQQWSRPELNALEKALNRRVNREMEYW